MADSATKQECPDFGQGFSLLSDLELKRGIEQTRYVLRLVAAKIEETLNPQYTVLSQSGLEILLKAKHSAQSDLEGMLSERAKRDKQREQKRATITLPVQTDQWGNVIGTVSPIKAAKNQ